MVSSRNSQTSIESSALAKFLQTLNVGHSSVQIVVDNARPTALDRHIIGGGEQSRESQDSTATTKTRRPHGSNDASLGKKRRRRVSFNYKIRVVNCSALTNTDELFYTEKEYKKMKKEIKATLLRHMMEDESSSSNDDDTIDCMRGIETHLEDARAAKNRARLRACLAVLTEQKRQLLEDGNVIPMDGQELSRRYQQVSLECQWEAIQRGLKDWVDICPPSYKSTTQDQTPIGYEFGVAAPTICPKIRAISSFAA
ncbi:unnamed protein product [Cylindrotheca closterium]|uniref:Uncharacterized protein n=1 Tax=Cylindrotheca closterium TaxID=2856 RepID=A0AAD2FNA5_9STRA|nr:unnamed protein product [Cylindrotheca closterium]